MSMSNLSRLATISRLAVIIAVFGCGQLAWADVTVRFDPVDSTVGLGDEFTVDIVADIPDPVLGWGLDLGFDDTILSQVGSPEIVYPPWSAVATVDGDGLAGLAFPFPISGSGITLATMTFSADALGISDLIAGVTPGDLTEGFALDPTGFAEPIFEAGQVTVVPAPGAALLGFIGLVSVGWLRRRLA